MEMNEVLALLISFGMLVALIMSESKNKSAECLLKNVEIGAAQLR